MVEEIAIASTNDLVIVIQDKWPSTYTDQLILDKVNQKDHGK